MATAEAYIDGEETQVVELTHIDAATALTAADRAQIDIQIATAKRYPRDLAKFRRDALALVAADEDVAGSMFYALPRKSKGKTTYIEGPSIRFAEAMTYCWGNLRVEARIVAVDDVHVTAQGTCMDLEKNIGCRVEVKRRITDSGGKRYSEDMIVVTGNAASSIAFRNAVFKVIPFSLAKSIYDQAVRVATGGAQPIEARRQKALQWFARAGAPEARVLAQLGVATVDEITEEHLITLTGLKNAIKEGETTIERAFAPADEPAERTADLADRLKNAAPSEKQKKAEPQEVVDTTTGEALTADSARADLEAAIGTMSPRGGDASDAQRDKIRSLAVATFGDSELKEALFLLADDERLGKTQAGLLIGKIQLAQAASGAGA